MLNLRNLTLLTAALLSLHIGAVQAEVQQVTLKWLAMQCQASCVRGLEKQLRRIRGVASVDISEPQGQAILQWDPTVPFSYRSIEAAIAMIGIGIDPEDFGVTVRGNIIHDKSNVILVSIGDNTRFYLIGTPPFVPNQFIEENSLSNRALTPQIRSQLLEAERNHQFVTITGPLFQPEASPPLYLVVQSLNMSDNPLTTHGK